MNIGPSNGAEVLGPATQRQHSHNQRETGGCRALQQWALNQGMPAAPLGKDLKCPRLSLLPFQKRRLVWKCPGQEPLTFCLIPTMSEPTDQAVGARQVYREGLGATCRPHTCLPPGVFIVK